MKGNEIHEKCMKKYYDNPRLCGYCNRVISYEKRHNKTCCDECAKKLNVKHGKETMMKRYGVEHPLQVKEFKNKGIETTILRYGVENASSSKIIRDKVKNTCLERYGVDNARKIDGVTEKSKQTLIRKYGVDCPFSIDKDSKVKKAINTKMNKYGTLTMNSHRYEYDNFKFDSKEELYFYIYHHDIVGDDIKRGDVFQYLFEGKSHKYFCDFKLNNQNIEIKGGHLINTEGLYFPYLNQNKVDSSLKQKQYDAKYECMIQNNVRIILSNSDEMREIISIVKGRYGEDYIKQFDVKVKRDSNRLFEV